MTASQVLSGDARVMHTIARYLENLRETVDGDELYALIARTQRRHSRQGSLGHAYLSDLYGQLDAYARDALSLPSMRIRARLLQQHIAPYIVDAKVEPVAPTAAVAPPRATPPSAPATTAESKRSKSNGAAPVEGVLERPAEKAESAARQRTEQYEVLLRSEKDAWQAIYGTVKDYQRLKEAWLKSLDEIARQRDTLEGKLLKTSEQLSKLETEHQKLREELETARAASTKRPRAHAIPRLLSRLGQRASSVAKRDGFLRSLEAEIKRIKRSGAPLALGLIIIDNLDTLIDRFGTEAATAALRCYTDEVLSNFRAYDLVAIYDHDQFAVMFPDTSKEGARRALEKAYKRAVETHLNYGGESLPLPPFAGTLVMYSAGEDPARFLQRAGEALLNARASGSRGVVMS